MEHKPDPTCARLLTALFLSFMLLFGVLFFALPDQDFSAQENRSLAAFPRFSLHALFYEGWTQRFEAYAADQFPGRNAWVNAKAVSEYLIGKRENNGVYLGKDEMLLLDYQSGDRTLENAQRVADFAASAGVPVRFGLIPDSILLNCALLPPFSLAADQAADIAAAYAIAPGVDILAAMRAYPDPTALYYRTDHHWTAQGAYAAYTALAPALHIVPLSPDAFAQVTLSTDFQGTLQAKSGAWWVAPDKIEGWSPKSTPDARVEIYEGGALTTTLSGYYAMERLRTRDQYAVFLDGNHGRVIIKTGLHNGKRLLLIKDSFSHALAPLLAAHYEEIHLIDLRYYRTDYAAYIENHAISEALVLYSMSSFCSDSNLVFLKSR